MTADAETSGTAMAGAALIGTSGMAKRGILGLTMMCSSVIQTALRGNHCTVPRQVISADANIPAISQGARRYQGSPALQDAKARRDWHSCQATRR